MFFRQKTLPCLGFAVHKATHSNKVVFPCMYNKHTELTLKEEFIEEIKHICILATTFARWLGLAVRCYMFSSLHCLSFL